MTQTIKSVRHEVEFVFHHAVNCLDSRVSLRARRMATAIRARVLFPVDAPKFTTRRGVESQSREVFDDPDD